MSVLKLSSDVKVYIIPNNRYMTNLGGMKMKNNILISLLIFLTSLAYAEPKSCSTGFACPLDKLRTQEQLMQQQKLVDDIRKNNQQKMFKENKFEALNGKKNLNDFFVFTKSEQFY